MSDKIWNAGDARKEGYRCGWNDAITQLQSAISTHVNVPLKECKKLSEPYAWISIKEHGLPGTEYNGKWIQLLKTIDLPRHKEPIFFQRVWTDIDDPADYTLRKIYTHWREIEFPTRDAD